MVGAELSGSHAWGTTRFNTIISSTLSRSRWTNPSTGRENSMRVMKSGGNEVEIYESRRRASPGMLALMSERCS